MTVDIPLPPEFVAGLGTVIRHVQGVIVTSAAQRVLGANAQRYRMLSLRYPSQKYLSVAIPSHYGVMLVDDVGRSCMIHAMNMTAESLRVEPELKNLLVAKNIPIPTDAEGKDGVSVIVADAPRVHSAVVDREGACSLSIPALEAWATSETLASITSCLALMNRMFSDVNDVELRLHPRGEAPRATDRASSGDVVPQPTFVASLSRGLRIRGMNATKYIASWMRMTEIDQQLDSFELSARHAPTGSMSLKSKLEQATGSLFAASAAFYQNGPKDEEYAKLTAAIRRIPAPSEGSTMSLWEWSCNEIKDVCEFFNPPAECPVDPAPSSVQGAVEALQSHAKAAFEEARANAVVANFQWAAVGTGFRAYSLFGLLQALRHQHQGLQLDLEALTKLEILAGQVSATVEESLSKVEAAEQTVTNAMNECMNLAEFRTEHGMAGLQPFIASCESQRALLATALSTVHAVKDGVKDSLQRVTLLQGRVDQMKVQLGNRDTTVRDMRTQCIAAALGSGVQAVQLFFQLRELDALGKLNTGGAYLGIGLLIGHSVMTLVATGGAIESQAMLFEIGEAVALVEEYEACADAEYQRLTDGQGLLQSLVVEVERMQAVLAQRTQDAVNCIPTLISTGVAPRMIRPLPTAPGTR